MVTYSNAIDILKQVKSIYNDVVAKGDTSEDAHIVGDSFDKAIMALRGVSKERIDELLETSEYAKEMRSRLTQNYGTYLDQTVKDDNVPMIIAMKNLLVKINNCYAATPLPLYEESEYPKQEEIPFEEEKKEEIPATEAPKENPPVEEPAKTEEVPTTEAQAEKKEETPPADAPKAEEKPKEAPAKEAPKGHQQGKGKGGKGRK